MLCALPERLRLVKILTCRIQPRFSRQRQRSLRLSLMIQIFIAYMDRGSMNRRDLLLINHPLRRCRTTIMDLSLIEPRILWPTSLYAFLELHRLHKNRNKILPGDTEPLLRKRSIITTMIINTTKELPQLIKTRTHLTKVVISPRFQIPRPSTTLPLYPKSHQTIQASFQPPTTLSLPWTHLPPSRRPSPTRQSPTEQLPPNHSLPQPRTNPPLPTTHQLHTPHTLPNPRTRQERQHAPYSLLRRNTRNHGQARVLLLPPSHQRPEPPTPHRQPPPTQQMRKRS